MLGLLLCCFFFVCMMLDVRAEEIRLTTLSYLPVTSFLGFFFVYELVVILLDSLPVASNVLAYTNWAIVFFSQSNIVSLSSVSLYCL